MPDAWLVDASRRRITEFTSTLRTLTDSRVAVPGLDWTVAELAQHVACLPSFWNKQNALQSNWALPPDFAAYNDSARAHITETDVAALAELIGSELDSLVTVLANDREERWLYGVPVSATTMCGLILNELILHGRDLAGVTGTAPPMFERNEANAAVDAMMVTVPCFVDQNKADAQPDGIYHVRFWGGQDYTWTKTGTELKVAPGRPDQADAHLNADPAMFLMASLGRISQARAGLSGKMITYGRKPWRFIGLGKLAVDGV